MTELKYKLNLGAGYSPLPDMINVDIAPLEGINVVHNLEVFPWPWPDESVEEVFSSHFLEHIHDIFGFFNELYRVMKVGAKAKFITPYGGSVRAWQDPTHVRPIFPQTYQYLNRKWREDNKLTHYPVTCNFLSVCEFALNSEWHNRSTEARNFALVNYWNAADDLHCTLCKMP